jgi:tetratricopeptide (TPR) repeat protein
MQGSGIHGGLSSQRSELALALLTPIANRKFASDFKGEHEWCKLDTIACGVVKSQLFEVFYMPDSQDDACIALLLQPGEAQRYVRLADVIGESDGAEVAGKALSRATILAGGEPALRKRAQQYLETIGNSRHLTVIYRMNADDLPLEWMHHLKLGINLRKMNLDQPSLHIMRAAIIFPEFAPSYGELSFNLIYSRDFEKCMRVSKFQLICTCPLNNPKNLYLSLANFAEAALHVGNHLDVVKYADRIEKWCDRTPGVKALLWTLKVRHLLLLKRYDEARSILLRLIRSPPATYDAEIFAMLSLVEYGAGDIERYNYIANRNLVCQLDVGADYSPEELDEFNSNLIRQIKTHASLAPLASGTIGDVRITSTRGNHGLVSETEGAVGELKALILRKAAEYTDSLPERSGHYFLRFKDVPKKITRLWGVVGTRYDDSIPHYHRGTYMTAVYYAKIPDRFNDQDETKSGWLELFRPDLPVEFYDKDVDHILPRTGSIIFFPSHIYHRAMPCPFGEERVILACDITLERSAARAVQA